MECVPYSLENECESYLNGAMTPQRGAPQQLLFDGCLAQIISALRMVLGLDPVLACRRYIISLLCHAVYPPCEEVEGNHTTRFGKKSGKEGAESRWSVDLLSRENEHNATFEVMPFCWSSLLEGVQMCMIADNIVNGGKR